MRQKYYSGIGSRETPQNVLDRFVKLSRFLEHKNYVLRSGAADGADSYFESGVVKPKNKEIYLPWKGFNNSNSELHSICRKSAEMAAEIHPYWDNLKQGARKLQARNCYQVLGKDLETPSDFVCCWTDGGLTVGGTGQAIRLANKLGIRVFNFGIGFDGVARELMKYIEENE